jgi:ABC-type glycerol-3-phosphate transport system substrate-binding protein
MPFHLGKPILVMILISLVSGAVLIGHRTPPRKDLVLWTFTDIHADTYKSIIDQFERDSGQSVDIQLLATRAMNVRLESMFMSNQKGDILPDVVEIEVSQVGKYFRPPVDQIGFLPLNDYLHRGGWDRRIVASRFAPWSKHDVIFGVPHDVHPITITYRQDLFEQAGVHLEEAKTWPEFQELCVQFQAYWRAHGRSTRHALELSRANPDNLVVMLLQRGVNLVDADENIQVNDPLVAQTMAFYAQLIAGPRAIAGDALGGSGIWTRDLLDGNLCAFLTPDWRIFNFHSFAPQMEGKLRMMPLPRFDPTDIPTSTSGGTMIGITRNCPHPDQAWKLIEFLYLSRTGLEARQRVTNILPPVMDWWDQPIYHRADPYFGGQKIDELYIELARQIPKRYVTPETVIAQSELGVALSRAVAYVEEHGTDGLEAVCQRWLDLAASDLKARVKHNRFE